MKNSTIAAALSALMLVSGTSVSAEIGSGEGYKFINPCERGPLPRISILNKANKKFVRELLEVYPQISADAASYIAYELCRDLSIVGDNYALTQRLRVLVGKYSPAKSAAVQSQSVVTKTKANAPSTARASNAVLQLGLFSNEQNANKTLNAINASGLIGKKSRLNQNNQNLWRVVIADLSSSIDVSKAKKVARNLGINDAYLTNR